MSDEPQTPDTDGHPTLPVSDAAPGGSGVTDAKVGLSKRGVSGEAADAPGAGWSGGASAASAGTPSAGATPAGPAGARGVEMTPGEHAAAPGGSGTAGEPAGVPRARWDSVGPAGAAGAERNPGEPSYAPGAESNPGAPSDVPGVERNPGNADQSSRPEGDPWAPLVADSAPTPTASADDVPLAPSGDAPATTFGASGDAPTMSVSSGDGPGGTLVGNDPLSWPPPSVHDQRTVADATPPAQPWANPFAAPGQAAPATTPPNPFAPPVGGPPPGHVPPPPIAPDGPGQLPYGYGYPGGPQTYYGWPGAQPMPANGMGTAGLVLGVLSAIVFCLWPLAIILGILGVTFGAVGRGKAKRGEATNPGQALAGIICGAVGIALALTLGALVIVT